MEKEIKLKYQRLIEYIRELDNVAIAFSGGVDSTFLVYAAMEALGDNVTAFTVNSPYIPEWEVDEARQWISGLGVRHEVINVDIPDNIRENPPDRCYLCKKQIFGLLKAEMADRKISYLLEGTNKDDEGDYRPGMKALEELSVLSPLRATGFTKDEIRRMSRSLGLPTWNKPAYACLLTRIPYDTPVTAEELRRIEAGELELFRLGLAGARLRSHGNLARIELRQDQFIGFSDKEKRDAVVEKLRAAGYEYVCIDLEGYRMGSYNRTIDKSNNQ
ncbi:MAG TPA: ATP-dependent sacrificial sulfur transferase LarE [Bacteroidales bacterium]|nr:ATP-dependent sacrificial sulfur transferase LarE [Bacteroidales bacterium]